MSCYVNAPPVTLIGAQSWRWQDNKKARQSAAPSMGRPGVVKDDRKTIYVKNLPFRATEEELDGFFSQVGKVVDVRRGTTADGGNPLAYCILYKYFVN